MPYARRAAAALNADGRLEYFEVAEGEGIAHIWQTAPGGGWSHWALIGGIPATDGLAVERTADGRLEVYARGQDDTLYHAWQIAACGDFGP